MTGTLTIDPSYGSGVTAKYKACITAAIDLIEALFVPENSVTENVEFTATAAGSGAGYAATNKFGYTTVNYGQLAAALPASDVLPADPAPGAKWTITQAYAEMLGIVPSSPNPSGVEDIVTLNTSPNAAGVSLTYGQDVINVLTHELSEGVLGRTGGLGANAFGKTGATPSWSVMDLFRYNGAGQYDPSNGEDGQTTYFSSDGGATLSKSAGLSFFNNLSPSGAFAGGDTADWAENAVFGGVAAGETLTLKQTELNVMAALGWTISMPQDLFEKSGNWQTPTDWSIGCMPITSEDAYIGVDSENPVEATSNNNVTVNSVGTAFGSTLIIGDNSTLTAIHGTVLSHATPETLWQDNDGTVQVDTGSTFAIGNAFENFGELVVGYSPTGSGEGYLTLIDNVTLDGGGTVELGDKAQGKYSRGKISGSYGLINANETIEGGGLIDVKKFDNQAKGVIDANQAKAHSLSIDATTFANEGQMNIGTSAKLDLGSDGGTNKLTNTGSINIGWDGSHADDDAGLSISGVMTITGDGDIAMKGAGAELTSDGQGPSTLDNQSSIVAYASGQIGDVGLTNGGVNDLTFNNNDGTTVADGAGVTLTLNTGADTVGDGGGTLEAEGGATLAILSNVATGQPRPGRQVPPGGTIEAAADGTITLSASVFGGVTPAPFTGQPFPTSSVAGQVVVAAGGAFNVLSGASVAVPVEIDGASSTEPGGVFDVLNGGSLTGDVTFESAKASLELDHNASTVDVTGSGGTIDLTSANVSLSSGNETFDFAPAFGKDAISGFVSSDTIEFSVIDFASWSALQPHIAQSGANTTITLDANDVITLDNVKASSLMASHIEFR